MSTLQRGDQIEADFYKLKSQEFGPLSSADEVRRVVEKAVSAHHLAKLIEWSKDAVSRMTPAERDHMIAEQARSWARSEAQWAKDYAEGKCERD